MRHNDFLDIIIAKETLEDFGKRFQRLTTWQRFITCLWLLGWSHQEIAEVVGTTPQNVSWVTIEARKRLGVYYQWPTKKYH